MRNILGTLIASVFLATAAIAAPWTKENLEQHIGETNFILDDKCSGTLINRENNIILTAYHCVPVDWEQDIEVKQHIYEGHKVYSSFMSQARVVMTDKSNDLALIQVNTPVMPYSLEASISNGNVVVGDDVYVVGNPFGRLDNTVTKGVVSSTHRIIRDRKVWQIDATVVGGNSGGGVYNENGELIGVISSGLVSKVGPVSIPLGFNFISPLETVQNLVDKYESQ